MVVGAVFMLAVALTLFGTVVVSGWDLFGRKVDWQVQLKDVRNLEVGDEVHVLGSRMGRVRDIRFDHKQYVFWVVCRMEANAPIHEGYRISVRDTSALGGKFLHVDPGDPKAAAIDPRTTKLEGSPGGNVMEDISDALAEVRKAVEGVNRGEGTLGSIIFKDDVYRNIREATASLKAVAQRLEAGEGSAGALLTDRALYEQIKQLVARLNSDDSALGKLATKESGEIVDNLLAASASIKAILAKANDGEGSLAKLLNDDTLYKNASSAIATANNVMDDVRAGKGVAGMLVNDPEARKNVSDSLESIQVVLGDAREGRGTVGRLFTDEALYKNLSAVAENLSQAAEKINQGGGTVARLLNDPDIHDSVKKILAKAVDAIENARDSAPVSAILSAIGAPFQ